MKKAVCASLMLLCFIPSRAFTQWSNSTELHFLSKNELEKKEFSSEEETKLNGLEWIQTNSFKFNKNHQISGSFFSRAYSGTHNYQQKFFIDPKDVSYNFQKRSLFISLGVKPLGWSGTDIINPMDSLSSVDLTDPLKPRSRSIPGLFITQNLALQMSLDFIWVPEQFTSLLPSSKSSWFPQDVKFPIENEDAELRLPKQAEYDIKKTKHLNESKKNNFGIRWSKTMDSYEFSLSYSESQSSLPILAPTLNGDLLSLTPKLIVQLNNPIEITPIYYRQKTWSGYTSFPFIFESGIKLAIKNSQPVGEAKSLTANQTLSVLSLEKNTSIGPTDIYYLIGWIWNQQNSSNQNQTQLQIYKNAWSLGAKINFFDYHQISVMSLYEDSQSLMIYQTNYKYTFTDNWSAELGYSAVKISQKSLFYYLKNNSRLDFTLSCYL